MKKKVFCIILSLSVGLNGILLCRNLGSKWKLEYFDMIQDYYEFGKEPMSSLIHFPEDVLENVLLSNHYRVYNQWFSGIADELKLYYTYSLEGGYDEFLVYYNHLIRQCNFQEIDENGFNLVSSHGEDEFVYKIFMNCSYEKNKINIEIYLTSK